MRYFLTGTAGFIGFHLAKRLLDLGHDVVGYDGMTPYYDVAMKQRRHAILEQFETFRPVIGMLEDRYVLARAMEEAKAEVIIHLAAQAGVRYSLENPQAYVDANITGSWNLIDLARSMQPRHLMLASTSSIYGANESVPFGETDRADEPFTLYAATKKSMELFAHSYAHLYRVPTTAFRFFTVYGPHGRPDMALFKFVVDILNGRPVEIYGEGRMRRDFTYVDDLVEAVLRLVPIAPGEENRVADIDSLSSHAPFRVVNIGGGQPVDLLHFVDTIEAATGCEVRKIMLPMQLGDVPQTYAQTALLQALTGFTPTVRIEDGVKRFVDWYRRDYAGQ